jgi:hypothetical protein
MVLLLIQRRCRAVDCGKELHFRGQRPERLLIIDVNKTLTSQNSFQPFSDRSEQRIACGRLWLSADGPERRMV